MCLCVETCGPNEALIISGVFHSPPTFILGGRAIVLPCVQRVQRLSLEVMTLVIDSRRIQGNKGDPQGRVYTAQGVPISVTGVAQVKVNGSNEEMLRLAAEHFGGRDMEEIQNVALETLEGHQRAIMGTMTVEQIYRDRKTFSNRVFEVASLDLAGMGFIIISYTLRDIKDDVGYLESLGKARTAEVQRDAAIGKAEAQMETEIKQSMAKEQLMKSKYSNDIEIGRAKRDYDVTKAMYDAEVFTAKAEADLASKLGALIQMQKIATENKEVEIVERLKQIEVAELEIQRTELQLDHNIRKPAEAEKYRLEKIAEAEKKKLILEAEALAEAIAMRGEAEAYAIEIKAKAEAEQMAKKAEAWASYTDAAKAEMLLTALPKIVSEVAAPLLNISKIRMVSDGSSETVGAQRITNEVLSIVKSIPEVVNSLTGLSVLEVKANG